MLPNEADFFILKFFQCFFCFVLFLINFFNLKILLFKFNLFFISVLVYFFQIFPYFSFISINKNILIFHVNDNNTFKSDHMRKCKKKKRLWIGMRVCW